MEYGRIELELPEWRTFTNNPLLILWENKASDHSSFDRITEFSVWAPELSSCFDQFVNDYRWFKIDEKSQLKKDVPELLSLDFFRVHGSMANAALLMSEERR